MSAWRDGMVAELKRVVVPVLRELGFKGPFPHFRREGEGLSRVASEARNYPHDR